MVRENLNQTKTLAHQHHVFAEFAQAAKIRAVRLAPVGEAAIAFALVMREGRIDITISAISDFGCLDHASRIAAPVEHDPPLAWRRCVRLILGAAGGGLDALENKFEQFVGECRAVAERERTQPPIGFRNNWIAHELNPPASAGTSSGLKP